ncbi:uncharacterized protein IUM83_13645 [Phytophthora cinnamomi]|uniref:uncharacterized protein n=1 Tax=Phytophthora cinnamomi TaxID=4785 RepID=UPI00355A0FEB|nr:hypothetical protein IUM83_13645 [Phytophthora cinnamomi]
MAHFNAIRFNVSAISGGLLPGRAAGSADTAAEIIGQRSWIDKTADSKAGDRAALCSSLRLSAWPEKYDYR